MEFTKGATSQTIEVPILDSTSTNGGRKTGLAFNTAGLTAYYVRHRAAPVAITLITQTPTGAYSSGGFVEIDATNAPGLYRLDVPDAVFATGVDGAVIVLKGASGMNQVEYGVELRAIDLQAAALPANLTQILGTALTETGGQLAAGFKKLFDVAAPVFTLLSVNQSGDAFNRIGLAGAGLTNLGDTRLAHLDVDVSSRLAAAGYTAPDNATIGQILTFVDTEIQAIYDRLGIPATTSIAADIATRLASASYTAPNNAGISMILSLVDTEIQAIFDRLGMPATTSIAADIATRLASASYTAPDNAGIAAAALVASALATAMEADGPVYRFTMNALEQGPVSGAAPTAQDITDAILDEIISGHTVPGSVAVAIGAAGSAADPLLNQVPGSYGPGTAGAALGGIGTGTIQVTFIGPIAEDGRVTLVQGFDYFAVDGLALEWTSDLWPNLTGATVYFDILRPTGGVLTVEGSAPTVGMGTQVVRVEPDQADLVLDPGQYGFTVRAILANAHMVPLVVGEAIILENNRNNP